MKRFWQVVWSPSMLLLVASIAFFVGVAYATGK